MEKEKNAKKAKKIEKKLNESEGKVEITSSSKKRSKADDNDDLDDLFADLRKRKKVKEVEEVRQSAELKEKSSKADEVGTRPEAPGKDYGRIKSNVRIKVDPRIVNPEAPVHRWDKESGLPVYKAAALKVFTEESGGTPDCPFDCNCCF